MKYKEHMGIVEKVLGRIEEQCFFVFFDAMRLSRYPEDREPITIYADELQSVYLALLEWSVWKKESENET